jgi:cytoskeletal protein RodZ
MWPFNRRKKNNSTNTVPPEVQEYYQTERRKRVGVAWLLAIGTLLITMALALALFFGGRWIYRTVRKHDKKNTGTSQTAQQSPQSNPTNTNTSSNSSSTTAPSSSAPTPTPAAATPSAPTPASTPQNSGQLTNTGPGDTVAIFFAVALLGMAAHQVYVRRKLTS